jgi:opacity protein-like surface antigen
MKHCFILVFLCLLTGSVIGQKFNGGLLAGFSASQVDGDTYSGYNKIGAMGGVFVSAPIFPKVDAILEIKYMGKGAHKKSTENDPTLYTSKLRYIELPLILRFINKTKIDWEVGSGVGYLFSHAEEDEYGEIPPSNSPKFKKLEINTMLGMGYNITQHWAARLRFSYSLFPIIKTYTDSRYYFYNRGAYNNLFSFGMFYTFNDH